MLFPQSFVIMWSVSGNLFITKHIFCFIDSCSVHDISNRTRDAIPLIRNFLSCWQEWTSHLFPWHSLHIISINLFRVKYRVIKNKLLNAEVSGAYSTKSAGIYTTDNSMMRFPFVKQKFSLQQFLEMWLCNKCSQGCCILMHNITSQNCLMCLKQMVSLSTFTVNRVNFNKRKTKNNKLEHFKKNLIIVCFWTDRAHFKRKSMTFKNIPCILPYFQRFCRCAYPEKKHEMKSAPTLLFLLCFCAL